MGFLDRYAILHLTDQPIPHAHRRGEIFVFGSNMAGIHGAGAAKEAFEHHGADWHMGMGRMSGNSYAIPTKSARLESLPLDIISLFVTNFKTYAQFHPHLNFFVTRIGCGLAGYKDKDIAPFFKDAPENCRLPPGWRES